MLIRRCIPKLPASLVLAVLVLSTTSLAFAQAPGGTPPAGAPPAGAPARRPMPAPSNLKVLPKDMTGQQVVAIMHKWEGDLGVNCSYCHAKDPATGRNNFASDDNPLKDKARLMLTMNMEINKDFIAKLTPPTEAKVTCGTCHGGMAKPAIFVPKPEEPRTPPATAPK